MAGLRPTHTPLCGASCFPLRSITQKQTQFFDHGNLGLMELRDGCRKCRTRHRAWPEMSKQSQSAWPSWPALLGNAGNVSEIDKQSQFPGVGLDLTARKCADTVRRVKVPSGPKWTNKANRPESSWRPAPKHVDVVECVESIPPPRPQMHKQSQFARPRHLRTLCPEMSGKN
jgi:hypothetical protein